MIRSVGCILLILLGAAQFGCATRSNVMQAASRTPLQRYQFTQIHMGVAVRIVLYAENEGQAKSVARAGFAAFAQIDEIASDWRKDSELMQLCARAGTGPVPVSKHLLELLLVSRHVSEESDGAFDCTVGPVSHLWRDAINKGSTRVDDQALANAQQLVGMDLLTINESTCTVTLAKPGMMLDLGGVAKGYAADMALHEMKRAGISQALVDASGDIAIGGAPPDAAGWRVAVTTGVNTAPDDEFILTHCAIATSGSVYQHMRVDGIEYSHIVSPNSGHATTGSFGACVIATTCAAADAWATAACVIANENASQLQSCAGDATGVRFLQYDRINADGGIYQIRVGSAP
ncbi:MAG: FAD:protein FMN transferase [Phycisphaeraceae bacterium]|nr:FAD:protein FMN transferase [Phycisphaerales bacterium]MCB9859351.1 FAD:protein FMN transferase [Phycisphaeraceae bacterium]